MSSSNTDEATAGGDQQAPKRTKKKTLGAGRKTKTSMVDIVSSAPTGTGYLETNPFDNEQATGEAAASEAGEPSTPVGTSSAVNSEDADPAPAVQQETEEPAMPTPSPVAGEGQAASTPTATAAPTREEERSSSEPPPASSAVNSEDADPAPAVQQEEEPKPAAPAAAPRAPAGGHQVAAAHAAPATSNTSSAADVAPKVSWTVHAKNARAALLGVTKALDKVDARAQDVGEVLRTAGSSLPQQDLVAIVHEVAARTGHPVSEIVRVANLDLPVTDSHE